MANAFLAGWTFVHLRLYLLGCRRTVISRASHFTELRNL